MIILLFVSDDVQVELLFKLLVAGGVSHNVKDLYKILHEIANHLLNSHIADDSSLQFPEQ